MMALPSESEISSRVRRAIEASGSLFDDVVGVRFRIRGAAQRSDEATRLLRQGGVALNQLERIVDLSRDASAVGQTTKRAKLLRGRSVVASLEIAEPEVQSRIRPLRVLTDRLAEVCDRLVVTLLLVARDPQPHEGIRPFRALLEGRLELRRGVRVATLVERGLSQTVGGRAAAEREDERGQQRRIVPAPWHRGLIHGRS